MYCAVFSSHFLVLFNIKFPWTGEHCTFSLGSSYCSMPQAMKRTTLIQSLYCARCKPQFL